MIDFLNMAEDEEAKLFSVSGDDEAHNIKEEGWIKLGQLFSIREEEVEMCIRDSGYRICFFSFPYPYGEEEKVILCQRTAQTDYIGYGLISV